MIKNLLKYFLLIITCGMIFLSGIELAYSDSGWDSDYDSGGWDSDYDSGGWDSDYDSGDWDSDWGSDWDSDYSSGSSDLEPGEAIIIAVVFIIFVLVFCYLTSSSSISRPDNSDNSIDFDSYYEDNLEKIDKYLSEYDLIKLKEELFNVFVDIQNAWMNFEYDKLRSLCTDELYNTYKSQLQVLKAKNGKNIMEYFENCATKIVDIKIQNNNMILSVYMKIRFYDYVIDTKTNEVTRGSDQRKLCNNYMMTFIKSTEDKNDIVNCPNCGAKLKDTHSSNCEYCDAPIVKDSKKFILSKKTNINKS